MPTVAFQSPVDSPLRFGQTEPQAIKTVPAEVTVDTEDTTAGSVTYPVVKTIQATFTYIGKLEPTPIPDLED